MKNEIDKLKEEFEEAREKCERTSNEVKENIRQSLIAEGHMSEIYRLYVNVYLSPWLTTEEIRKELVNGLSKEYEEENKNE